MKRFFDSLNLGTQERRLVVGAFFAVFIVLNIWFVFPHYKDWKIVTAQLKESQDTLKNHQSTVARLRADHDKVTKLEPVSGAVPKDEQAVQFQRTVQALTSSHRIYVSRSTLSASNPPQRNGTSTNAFFEERTMTIIFSAEESDLVDFLYQLGSGSSVIRVRDLSMKPDQTQTKLTGQLVLVASYQANTDDKPKADTLKNSASKKL